MEWMLRMNMAVCMVVPCIVAARKLLLYRVPGRTWLLLWKILLLRLVCPFTFALPLKGADAGRKTADILLKGAGAGVKAPSLLRLRERTEFSGCGISLLSAGEMLKILWLAGAAAIAGAVIGSHLIKRREYRMALPVRDIYVEQWKKSHSLKRKPEVRESDRISSPLTYGLVRPVILLPAHGKISGRSLGFVLEHELIHIRHLDILLKWILVLICSVYWYNPLIWVMYVFVNRDIELACDEALLRHHTPGYRKAYLEILIDLEERKAQRDFLCGSFSKYPIEERIRVMMKTEKGKLRGILVSAFIVCAIALLNIGTAVKAETGYSYEESEMDVAKRDGVPGGIPCVINCDEERAGRMVWEQGLCYIIDTGSYIH